MAMNLSRTVWIHHDIVFLSNIPILFIFIWSLKVFDQICHMLDLIRDLPSAQGNIKTFPFHKIIFLIVPDLLSDYFLYHEIFVLVPLEFKIIYFRLDFHLALLQKRPSNSPFWFFLLGLFFFLIVIRVFTAHICVESILLQIKKIREREKSLILLFRWVRIVFNVNLFIFDLPEHQFQLLFVLLDVPNHFIPLPDPSDYFKFFPNTIELITINLIDHLSSFKGDVVMFGVMHFAEVGIWRPPFIAQFHILIVIEISFQSFTVPTVWLGYELGLQDPAAFYQLGKLNRQSFIILRERLRWLRRTIWAYWPGTWFNSGTDSGMVRAWLGLLFGL